MAENDNILIQNTPERFRPMAAEIVPPLLALLRARSALEQEICQRHKARRQEYLAAGGSKNQIAPGEQELWEEYRRRYLELVEPWCAPGFLKYGAVSSLACPAKYSGLAPGMVYQVTFTMRTAKKATVVTSYPRGSLEFMHRFTLCPGPEGWLVEKLQYHHSNETTWHIDHYL